jgi:uncharacterized protein YggU (UPF0235/DUF167 family)
VDRTVCLRLWSSVFQIQGVFVVALEQTEHGIAISVKAHPGARRNAITGVHNGALKVAVSQAPERGKATAAIVELLAESLGLKKSQIDVLAGQTSTRKKLLLRGVDLTELTQKLADVVRELEAN